MKTNDEKSLIIKNKETLNNLCTIKTGRRDVNESDDNGKYPFFTCAKQTYKINTYSFDGQAILISGNGDIGQIKLFNGKFDAYQRTYVLMNFKCDIYFLKYLLEKKLSKVIMKEKQSSAMPYIKLSTISNIKINLPSNEHQLKIGKLFLCLDELITLHEEKLAALETYNKGLRQKLFNQSIRFKSFDGTSYPDWEKKRLEDVCELITKGTTPKNYSDNLNDVNYIKIESIVSNKICLDKCVKIDESIHQGILKRSILKEGDILFAIAGSLGTMAIVENKILPANTNQALAIIRLNKNCCAEYIYAVLHSIIMSQYINQCCTIGAQPNLSLKQMNDFVFPYPCLKEQQKIAEVLSCADELTEQIKNKILLLKITKTSLLNDIFD